MAKNSLQYKLVLLVLILLGACSNTSTVTTPLTQTPTGYQNAPSQTATFTANIISTPSMGSTLHIAPENICAFWDARVLWEPGDFYDSIDDIAPHVTVKLDQETIPRESLEILWMGSLNVIHDPNGKPIDVHGLLIGFCTEFSGERGPYLATLHLTRTSGSTYVYSWDFVVE